MLLKRIKIKKSLCEYYKNNTNKQEILQDYTKYAMINMYNCKYIIANINFKSEKERNEIHEKIF